MMALQDAVRFRLLERLGQRNRVIVNPDGKPAVELTYGI